MDVCQSKGWLYFRKMGGSVRVNNAYEMSFSQMVTKMGGLSQGDCLIEIGVEVNKELGCYDGD